MKKFFSLCTAVSVMLTGLVSCGGGGDENPGFVTAENFRGGAGFKLLQNPQLEIVAGHSNDVEGDWPTDSNGNPAIPPLVVPGTGQDEILDDPATPDVDEGQEYIPPTELTPVGTMAIVNRTIKAGGALVGNVDVTYVMTSEDIAVMTMSAPFAKILENPSFLTGLGIAAEDNNGNNWNNNNADNETLSRVRVNDLSACTIEIYFNFTSGQAMVLISASGVEVAGEDDEDDAFQPGKVIITASSVPFLVTH